MATSTRLSVMSKSSRTAACPAAVCRTHRPIPTTTSVTGSEESAGISSGDGGTSAGQQFGAECGHHGAVVRAQSWAWAPGAGSRPRRSARAASARSRELAATPPPMIRSATPFRLHAATALAVSTSATDSWNDAATSLTGTGSPAACRASIQRATAVFSPAKEKSSVPSRYLPRGNAIADPSPLPGRGVDRRAAGERQPEHPRHLVVGFAGRVVDGRAERHHLGSDVGHQQQRGMPARHQQGDRGNRQRAVLELVHRDVRGQVVDPVQRLAQRGRVGLRRGHPDQQGAGQARARCHRDRVHRGQLLPGRSPARGPPREPSPPGAPGWPPRAPRRRTGRARPRWRPPRRPAVRARGPAPPRSRRTTSRCRAPAARSWPPLRRPRPWRGGQAGRRSRISRGQACRSRSRAAGPAAGRVRGACRRITIASVPLGW